MHIYGAGQPLERNCNEMHNNSNYAYAALYGWARASLALTLAPIPSAPAGASPINPSPLRTQLVNRKYLKLFRLNASHRIQANDADSVGKKKSQREMRLQKIWFRSFIKNQIRQVQVEWKNICIYIFRPTLEHSRVSLTTYDLFLTRLLQHHNEHPSRPLAKQSEWQNASQKNKPFKNRTRIVFICVLAHVCCCRLSRIFGIFLVRFAKQLI